MKILFVILFFVFLIVGFITSPNQDQELVRTLLAGKFTLVDESIFAVFCALGMLPTLLGFYLIPQRHFYKLNVWPFWIASFFFGAGALLPYLVLTKPKLNSKPNNLPLVMELAPWEKLIANKFIKFFFGALILLTVALGFIKGSPEKYLLAFQSSRLVHVMSVDFCILVFIIWPYLIFRDLSTKTY